MKSLVQNIRKMLSRQGQSEKDSTRPIPIPRAQMSLSEINELKNVLDFSRAEVIQDPYPFYAALRQHGPVHYLKAQNSWVIVDYDSVSSALKQPEVFSSKVRQGVDPVLLAADPPSHTRVRQMVSPHFLGRDLSFMSEFIEQCSERLLTGFCKKGQFEVVYDFAMPLAEQCNGYFLGISPEATAQLMERTKTAKSYEAEYFLRVRTFFSEHLGNEESHSEGGLIQKLHNSQNDAGLHTEELVSLLTLLWIAGIATTRMFLSTAIYVIIHGRDVSTQLRENKELMPQFVEEVLRFDSPSQHAPRMTNSPVEIGGTTIPANAYVKLCLGAANRDPNHYSNPDTFDLSRNPKDHLSFGGGPHYCLGASLTRMEAKIALSILLEKCPNLRAIDPKEAARYEPLEEARALEKLRVEV